jgi:hypothetical protein
VDAEELGHLGDRQGDQGDQGNPCLGSLRKVIKVIKVISRRACHGKVIKVIMGTLIILGDHLDRLAKSARGQKFSLIQSAKLAILYRWN